MPRMTALTTWAGLDSCSMSAQRSTAATETKERFDATQRLHTVKQAATCPYMLQDQQPDNEIN